MKNFFMKVKRKLAIALTAIATVSMMGVGVDAAEVSYVDDINASSVSYGTNGIHGTPINDFSRVAGSLSINHTIIRGTSYWTTPINITTTTQKIEVSINIPSNTSLLVNIIDTSTGVSYAQWNVSGTGKLQSKTLTTGRTGSYYFQVTNSTANTFSATGNVTW